MNNTSIYREHNRNINDIQTSYDKQIVTWKDAYTKEHQRCIELSAKLAKAEEALSKLGLCLT